jgi:hypothetical protein
MEHKLCTHIDLEENSSLRRRAIKHQIRKMMFEDLINEEAAITRAEAICPSLSEETRPV